MAGKTILFNVFNFSERGEPICVYNYAKYNEEILGNSSVIVAPYEAERFSLERFKSRFPDIFFYRSQEELRRITEQADLLYLITSGVMTSSIDVGNLACRVGIHCVFTAHHRHGDVYAAISEWVADTYALHDVPVVPHIVILPDTDEDLRNELGIPEDAVVFGRHGGYEQFNILSIMQTIAQSLNDRKDIYFLFMNTAPFYEHPR